MDDISITKNTITFDNEFNEPITIEMVKLMKIPKNYILKFGEKFNNKIDGNIIEGIKIIIFKNDFNQSVDNLPNTLEELLFGNNFNQNVDNLPNKLKILYLGNNFNKSVDKLFGNLSTLVIQSKSFNQNLNNLPKNLMQLSIIDSEFLPNHEYIIVSPV